MQYHEEQLELNDEYIYLKDRWTGNSSTCCNDRLYYTYQKFRYLIIQCLLILQTSFYQYLYFDIIQCILSIALFISLSTIYFTDPGILPKIYYKYEDNQEKLKIPQSSKKRLSPHIILISNSHTFRYKYCPTCKIFRPPRFTHCAYCDSCIFRFDHHCNWIGTCIGIRNYKQFYIFLTIINIMWLKELCVLKIHYYSLLISVLFILTMILQFYHSFLIYQNMTTVEHLKKVWEIDSGNPYKTSWYKNCLQFICLKNRKQLVKMNSKLYTQLIKTQLSTVEMVTMD